MGRKILFITTDQQRYDALGCNGNASARTPAVSPLAADGSTTGSHNRTDARPLDHAHRSVRAHARGVRQQRPAAGAGRRRYSRAGRVPHRVLGKAHFDPIDVHFPENDGREG
jgi:hypothetical protein